MLEEILLGATTIATAGGTWLSCRRIARRPPPPPPEPYQLSYAVAWPKEPWRARADADTITALPTWWVHSIADPDELAGAARHDYRLEGLRPLIDAIGITTPLLANIDQLGRVCLADGHHRLAVALDLGLAECPVKFSTVARIGGYGVPVGPAVNALVTRTPAAGRSRASGRVALPAR